VPAPESSTHPRPRQDNEISWFDWEAGFTRGVAVFPNGETIPTTDSYGEGIVDDSFLGIFNASDQPIEWQTQIRYELSNRPHWVGRPIASIVDLIADETP